MKSSGKAFVIGTAVLSVVGVVGFISNVEAEKVELGPIQTTVAVAKTTPQTPKQTQPTSARNPSNSAQVYRSYEGKVASYDGKKLTIDIPGVGKKTFTVNAQTRIHDQWNRLEAGVLVEVDARGNAAYKIETERDIEGYGTIVQITKSSVIIEKNNSRVTFEKAARFHIDTDGYRGSVEGMRAQYKLNRDYQIIELEIEDDHDDD